MPRKPKSDDERALEFPVPTHGAKPTFHGFGDWLFAVVSPTGKRSWYMRYPSPTRFDKDGKPVRRDLKVGNIGVMLVDEARGVVRGHRRTIEIDRLDPTDVAGPAKIRAERKGNFDACVRASLVFAKDGWRTLTIRGEPVCATYDLRLDYYERFVKGLIGTYACDSVDTDAVLKVLEQPYEDTTLWRGANQAADVVRDIIKYALDFGAAKGYRDPKLRNPADRAALKFEIAQSKHVRAPSVPFAAVPFAAIPQLMQTLTEQRGVRALLLRAVFLTVKRSKAVGLGRWPEIDWDRRIWTFPVERLKFKKGSKIEEHLIRAGGWREPITDPLLDVIKGLWPLRASDDGYIFAGNPRDQHVALSSLAGTLHRLGYPETVHGSSRAGFKAWHLARDPDDRNYRKAELCSGRDARTLTNKSYDRDPDGLELRTPIMREWATFCTTPPRNNVVSLTDAAD